MADRQPAESATAVPGSQGPVLSIVVPAHQEQGNVGPLTSALHRVLGSLGEPYEIVFVDDGSRDATWDEIRAEAERDARVKGVRFARNFGHQRALLAGMAFASGQAVVSMDADLQHPPELIPDMVRAWREGNRIVTTIRQDAAESSAFKRATSRCFYRAFSYLARVPLGAGSSDFRLLDRQVLDNLLRFQHPELFLRGAVAWLGFPSASIPYQAQARHAGRSKYRLGVMLHFATTAVLSFSTRPLLIAVWVGVVTALVSLGELIYVLVQYARGETVPGWASTLAVMSFLFGVLFLLLGVMGAYLGSVHQALLNRPLYVVDKTVNLQGTSGHGSSDRRTP